MNQEVVCFTDHLYMDLNNKKVTVETPRDQPLMVFSEAKGQVVFRRNGTAITIIRDGPLYAYIGAEGPFRLHKYHVNFNAYPVVRKLLSPD